MPRPSLLTAMAATARRGGRAIFLAAVLAASLAITGCTGLPKDVDRPVSRALPTPGDTALGQLVEARRAADGAPHPSGFVLLSGPQAAYSSRLALVEGAQKTLDLQYYAIHADASSERLLRSLKAAAQRGVRVRVLLDDFHSTGHDAQVMRLAFVPNIEMRMFNPLTGARGAFIGRMFSLLGDFSRVQQRMHNKLFIADNAMGVTGGRNLGDAYFGNSDSGNFVDLDVLAAGPIVQDLSRSFDSYWNNERAYPVQSLITHDELKSLRARLRASDAVQRERLDSQGDATAAPSAQPPRGRRSTAQQRARIWNYEPLDLANPEQTPFVWAPAAMLVDTPAKIPADSASAATPQGAAPPDTGPQPDTVVDGLLQLMGLARRDLLIISPYFVPGPDMVRAFAAARARGVRVRVLTNSLASSDAPIAHAGYARHRPRLLAMGVELYEMRSELPGVLRDVLGSTGSMGGGGSTGSSRAMLHSKLLIVDGRLLAVGSMNLDIRSQRQNTEVALLIRSTELSRQATEPIETALRNAAWQVLRTDTGLLWRAPPGSGLEDATTEPDASAPLRLMLQLLGPLAPDHLL